MMSYIIVTLINFIIIYFCIHFVLWNKNCYYYWKKEKDFQRYAPPIWLWIIIILIGLSYWCGLIACIISLIAIIIGLCIDNDIIIDPKLSDWFKRTWLGKSIKSVIKLLIKEVSI